MTHHFKLWPGVYALVASGEKDHEIRKADRDVEFRKGDTAIYREWNPEVYEEQLRKSLNPAAPSEHERITAEARAYTARPPLMRTIGYVTKAGSWGLPADLCVFSIKSVK